ncbi:MAG TPA: hypothetical protein VEA41_17045 [Salinarimonas sp.]|nr:hypothetical protein [Salinarimonas sp.]
MVRAILAAVALAGLAAAAHASPAPAEAGPMDVAGVPPGDVLNLRAEPSAEARKVGELPPDAKGLEIGRCQEILRDRVVPAGTAGASRWCRVTLGAQSGWANARFLAAPPQPPVAPLYSTGPFGSDGAEQRSFLVSTTPLDGERFRAVTRHIVRRPAAAATLEESTSIVDCARRPEARGERDARNLWWAVCRGEMRKVKG